MIRYVGGRLVALLPVLLGISLVTFALANLTPGDPARLILERGGTVPTPAQVAALRQEMGLDGSVPARYVRWLGDALRGDLGRSYQSRRPVAEQLVLRLPVTLQVAAAGMLAGTLLALPLGVLAAVRRGGGADHAGRLLALLGSAFPSFWIGLLLMWVFAVQLRLLPVAGWRGPAYVVLPMITLGLGMAGPLSRMVRATMLDVLREDYVRTGRAKGLREWQVLYVHALRNALPPVVSMLGLAFGHLLGAW